MNPEIYKDVSQRLILDFNFKEKSDWLQQGTCPKCHKKELYTHADSPWVLRCGRLNKCGEEIHIKELYPDLFESFSDRYQPTQSNPNASADAFLINARGLDIAPLKGIYTQESYFDTKLQLGSATVRFTLAPNVYWERLIDKPNRFTRKANFIGKYQGLVWQHPNVDYHTAPDIWFTEGIFDALALIENGIPAVSLMSCSNFPTAFLAELKEHNPDVRIVAALDSDKAGQKHTKKLVEKLHLEHWNAVAAQPPFKLKGLSTPDWNDLHQRARLSSANINQYLHYGNLLTAKTATDKAMVIHAHSRKQLFLFDFDNRLFQFKLDFERYERAMRNLDDGEAFTSQGELVEKALIEANSITEIANCKPTALYYQRNLVTDESWYYFKIDFPAGEVVKSAFTAGQLYSASEFKKRLLHIAKGALWTGSGKQLDQFILNQNAQSIKTVDTVDFLGYSKAHQSYLFKDIAINQGKIIPLNEEDYFDVAKTSVKSLEHSVTLDINPNLKEYSEAWLPPLWEAFGAKGVIALSFWFGSLFSEQIRHHNKSYPFLEIVGEPGSGKSTLIEFMWKLFGRESYEGFDPSKSTVAARSRNLSQVSGMPVVFIEGDRMNDAKQKGFDWEETKPLYNGRSVRSRGMKTDGNQTYEPPFRGALVIAQNAPVDATPAVLERILHLYMSRTAQSATTKHAAEQLERFPMESLSGFIIKATVNEKRVMEVYHEQQKHYEHVLSERGLSHIRIIKNHAQLMALVESLSEVIQLKESWIESALDSILQLAKQREKAVQADHISLQEFWEAFEFLEESGCLLNHSSDERTIALNLNQFQQIASEWRQPLAPIVDLKALLKTGKHHPFIEIKTVKSAVNTTHNRTHTANLRPERLRCWVFKAKSPTR
ncbi:toprim domain-containing protein [uncultured Vibrio sp.]|uniref:toprim domain-containing protein n=4 Tax=uncultured Vibrio sp. TaxID=114054 RepID=UPI0026050E9C|nr:toprim domain-containing protein [uncultured Vibrio sp.]